MRFSIYPIFLVLTLALNLQVGAAEPEKKAATKEFDPEEALVGIPRDVAQDLRPGSRKLMDAVGKASQIVAKNVEGKMATVKFTILSLEKFQRPDSLDITRTRVKAVQDTIRASGASFKTFLMVVPDPSEDPKVAKLKKGDKVSFTGKIGNGEITAPGNTVDLHIDLVDAKLN